MAMYIAKYECEHCGERFFKYIDSKETGDTQECRKCSLQADWIPKVQPPAVMSDITPYRSHATGEMITSRNKHNSHLKDHGLIEVGNEKLEPAKADKQKERKERKQEIADVVYGRTKIDKTGDQS